MEQHQYRPDGKVMAAAVLAVAATYGYFLIFAQFGFLKSVAAAGVALRPVMTVMGLAGLAGSGWAAQAYAAGRRRRLMAAGFATCAIAAGGSLLAGSAGLFFGVALLVGLGAGFTTVTLASVLRCAVGGAWLGRIIGLGTGLAYGFCNLPAVFQAGARPQAWLAVLAAASGLVGTALLKFDAPAALPAGGDYARSSVSAWVMIFLALVGLDSAAFYFIQHTPVLLEGTWTGTGRLWMNAGMHLVTAVLAGRALDRRWIGRTVALGAALLLVACGLIAGGRTIFSTTVLLYTAGVSVYSVALVYYPAYSLRPWLAALVYAVAGWIGSAFGIGLAENRPALSPGIVVIVAVVIGSGLLGRQLILRRGTEQ
jgi:hypothetical protein